MDYEDRYLKDKDKYLKYKKNIMIGGTKSETYNNETKINEITDFIKNSSKKKIVKKLIDTLQYDKYCSNVLGEGFSGKVYIPVLDKTFPYKIKNKTLNLPIVVKVENELNNNEKPYFNTDILDNKLYISGYGGVTTEALILMLIRDLRKKTIHLPLLLTYATCNKTKLISTIVTMRYGLEKPIEIDLTGKIYDENTLWHKQETTNKFKNTIATLADLFTFIHYSKKDDDTVVLPNNIRCNVIELYDYLCISFLATHYLLTENDIYQSDMHVNNIFIHWFDDNSYYNDKNMKNIKEIIYKIKNKYYKIKTFGFALIFGDTGTFIIKIKKDVILIGQAPDIKNDYAKYDRRMNPNHNNMDFIYGVVGFLTPQQLNKCVANNILNVKPYNNYPIHNYKLLGTDISYLDALKSTPELLSFFDEKYGVDKYQRNEDNILIEI